MDKLITVLNEVRPGQDFPSVEDFFEQGVLDSLDLTALVAALEANYDVFIEVDELVPDNFRNMRAIKAILRRKGAYV